MQLYYICIIDLSIKTLWLERSILDNLSLIILHVEVGDNRRQLGAHCNAFSLLIKSSFICQICHGQHMLEKHNIWGEGGEESWLSRLIESAIGTIVNRETTSKLTLMSHRSIFRPSKTSTKSQELHTWWSHLPMCLANLLARNLTTLN